MRKTKIALAIAASAMISTPVLATNGDNLIGLGAQSRALGGTGTAAFFGSENALTNPALLGKAQGTEFAIGGTLFKPDVKAEANTFSPDGSKVSQTSEADTNIIPEVSLSTRINDNWTFGLGIFGSAGMGTDFRDTDELINGYSNLQLMKFAPSLAYNDGNFGIGFAPVIQYGALDINYNFMGNNIGNGMSSDLGYGFNLGGYFDVSKDFTVGVSYQSAISMEYDDQMSVASQPFVGFIPEAFDDKLEQPAEIKIGAAYTMGNWMFTADAKQIKWGDAEGYKDFNWEDQNVFGIGAKYSGNGYWVGAGYNFGSDPIDKLKDNTGTMNDYNAQVVNLFNNHFFPAVVESHITFGGGYNITKNMAIDAAVVYAPEVNKTVKTGLLSAALDPANPGVMDYGTEHEVTHSQIGYTVSLRMNF